MIHRIDVRTNAPVDPHGQSVRQQISQILPDPGLIRVARTFLIDSDATTQQIEHAASELLADPMIDLVMRRDGFDADQVRRTMEGAWRRLRLSRAGRDADAGDRVLPTSV